MSRYGFAIYKIQAVKNTEKLHLDDLPKVDGQGFARRLKSALGDLATSQFDNSIDRRLGLEVSDDQLGVHESTSAISARLRYGFYGDRAKIFDESNIEVFERTEKHTEAMPMTCYFLCKRSGEPSYALFQTYKTLGIKTVMQSFLDQKLSPVFDGTKFLLLPFWPQQLRDELMKEKPVDYIKVISRDTAADTADLNLTNDGDVEFIIETRYIPVKSGFKRKRADVYLDSTDLENVETSKIASGSEIQIGFRVDEGIKSIKAGGGFGRAPVIPTPFDTKHYSNGHPSFDVCRAEAAKICARFEL